MTALPQMSGFASVDTRRIDGFEELGDAVQGVEIEVLQLQPGRLRGYRTHMSVGGMPLSVGSFSVGVRTRGILSNDRITIGMLTGSANRVTQWSREMRPADIVVIPPGDDHDARFHGGASYAVISLDQAEIASHLGTEQRFRELGVGPKTLFRDNSPGGPFVVRRLRDLVTRLEDTRPRWSAGAAAFWKRSIIEIMTAPLLSNESRGSRWRHALGAKDRRQGRRLPRSNRIEARSYFRNLQRSSRFTQNPSSCLQRRDRHRPGRISPLPQTLLRSFHSAQQRPGDHHDRRRGHGSGLCKSWQVFRLLPRIVRRISIGDFGTFQLLDIPRQELCATSKTGAWIGA